MAVFYKLPKLGPPSLNFVIRNCVILNDMMKFVFSYVTRCINAHVIHKMQSILSISFLRVFLQRTIYTYVDVDAYVYVY